MPKTTQNEGEVAASRPVSKPSPKKAPRRTWLHVLLLAVAITGAALAGAVVYAARHAEPILRASVVRTLSERFHSPVELDHLDVSVVKGLQVRGEGLRVLHLADQEQPDEQQQSGAQQPDAQHLRGRAGSPPMLSVAEFSFRLPFRDLFERRARISEVEVAGLELHIPPHSGAMVPPRKTPRPRIDLIVDKVHCKDAKLFIETTKPGKDPLEFDIRNLDLTNVDAGHSLVYAADLVNPKPTGNIHAFGHFGPWRGDDPRSTPIDGDYRFDHADMDTIKGLGGTLSSTGHYAGQLGHLTVDGTAVVPDFSLDIGNHPMRLETRFHAYVDGTTGDTTLDPVEARLGKSEFTASGAVVRVHQPSGYRGHDIALTVNMPRGRMEDLLQLGMKTQPPLMRGAVSMQAKLHIPPDTSEGRQVRVAARLELSGRLAIQDVEFSNARLQDRIDGLSLRAQGRPQESGSAGNDRRPEVASDTSATFALSHEMMTVSSLRYQVPGAKVDLHGAYTLDGNIFEFKGHVRTQARASQMVTGWKSFLLKAVDPLLAKNGAGLELPISISGVKGDVRFGLATNVDETPKDMVNDVRERRQAQRESQHESQHDDVPKGSSPARPAPKPASASPGSAVGPE